MFVKRNAGGTIVGAYTTLQPGYAEEQIAEDNAEYIAFLTRLLNGETTAEKLRLDGIAADANTIDILNRIKTATSTEITNFINNNVTDLASAKVALIKLVLVIALMLRRKL